MGWVIRDVLRITISNYLELCLNKGNKSIYILPSLYIRMQYLGVVLKRHKIDYTLITYSASQSILFV